MSDYLTSYGEWLLAQNGRDRDQMFCDEVPRFIRNGRDLGQYVHVDLTFNAFLNAALILLSGREPLRRCDRRRRPGAPGCCRASGTAHVGKMRRVPPLTTR